MSFELLNPGWIPVAALGGMTAAAAGYGYLAPGCRMFLPVVSRGDRAGGTVALTFDDGPTPGGTTPILDLLGEHGVEAAFFVIGANVRRHPGLLERMHAEGHIVCNHSFDHLRVGALRPPEFWRDQIARTDEAIDEVIGLKPALFRAPLGHKSPSMRAPLREAGKTAVGWTRRAFDGIPMPAGVIAGRLSRARAGEVLLLHDGREYESRRDPGPTIAALPRVIAGIRRSGLELDRLDRHLRLTPYLAVREVDAGCTITSGSGGVPPEERRPHPSRGARARTHAPGGERAS